MKSTSKRRSIRDGNDHIDHSDDQLKLAGFHIGGALYGIDIMRIKEVIQAAPYKVRPVPNAPNLVEGVIQLRGVVIPIIDLRKRFGATIDPELNSLNKLIVVSVRGRIAGLKVDRVVGELRVSVGELRPAPSILKVETESIPEFFSGVCRIGDEMVFVVNLEGVVDNHSRNPAHA